MSETHEFRVTYDERVLRRAATAFVLHIMGGGIFLGTAFVLGSIYALYLVNFGQDSRLAGFVTGLVLCGVIWIVWLVIAWRRYSISTLRQMKEKSSAFKLVDETITITADTGSVTLPWSTFREILACKGCWLLRNATNRYVTLPTAGVPVEALAFVRAKIKAYKPIARGADKA